MSDETFSPGKFFGSFFQLIPWAKNIRYILGLILVVGICVMVYRAFFMPRTHIIAKKGSVVNYYENTKKRFRFIPYLDASYGKSGLRNQSFSNAEENWEARVGLRIEF